MALTSTLFTGLSGLDVNQTRLNVVGNNIANVNTVAFKSSRALFKPQFYVTDAGGTPPSGDFGGDQPQPARPRRGRRDDREGLLARRDRTDRQGHRPGHRRRRVLHRPGHRAEATPATARSALNAANQLVTTGGEFVQGYGVDDDGNIIAGAARATSRSRSARSPAPRRPRTSTLEGNLNANGAVATGASILTSQPLTTVGGGAAPAGAHAADRPAATTGTGHAAVHRRRRAHARRQEGRPRRSPTLTFTVDARPAPSASCRTFFSRAWASTRRVPDDRRPATPGAGVDDRRRPTPTAPARRHRQPRHRERAVARRHRVRQLGRQLAASRSPTAPTPRASPATRPARASTRASSSTTRSARRSPST